MFGRKVSMEEALRLLNMSAVDELSRAVEAGEIRPGEDSQSGWAFTLGEVMKLGLSRALRRIGVQADKTGSYAEAVLGQELFSDEKKLAEWVEHETQELFCLIADGELARIFLREKDTGKEVDIGAVKPVLFPMTECEVNVFRVIRPVLFNAVKGDITE
jgi:ribosomal protein L13E